MKKDPDQHALVVATHHLHDTIGGGGGGDEEVFRWDGLAWTWLVALLSRGA